MDYSVYQSDVLKNLVNSYWNNQQQQGDNTSDESEQIDNSQEESTENDTTDENSDLQSKYDDAISENDTLKRQLDDLDFYNNNDTNDMSFVNSLFDGDNTPKNFIDEANMYRSGDKPTTNANIEWLKTKNQSVNISNLDESLGSYLNSLPSEYKKQLLATSGNDGDVHVPNSKHYSGEAIDLRYNSDIYNYIAKDPNLQALGLKVLPPNHGTAPHIHIQKKKYGGKIMKDGGGKDNTKKKITTQDIPINYNDIPNYKPPLLNQKPIPSYSAINKFIADNITAYGYFLDNNNWVAPNDKLAQLSSQYSNDRVGFHKAIAPYMYNIKTGNRVAPNFTGETYSDRASNIIEGQPTATTSPRPENINASQDALNLFLGVPQKNNSWKQSAYKPTHTTEDAKYYSLTDESEIVNDLFKYRNKDFINSKDSVRHVNGSFAGQAALKNFKYSKGKDEKGDYVSYYDINDYGNILDYIGTPFEIYGRVYYDKKTGKPLPQKKYGGNYKVK